MNKVTNIATRNYFNHYKYLRTSTSKCTKMHHEFCYLLKNSAIWLLLVFFGQDLSGAKTFLVGVFFRRESYHFFHGIDVIFHQRSVAFLWRGQSADGNAFLIGRHHFALRKIEKNVVTAVDRTQCLPYNEHTN